MRKGDISRDRSVPLFLTPHAPRIDIPNGATGKGCCMEQPKKKKVATGIWSLADGRFFVRVHLVPGGDKTGYFPKETPVSELMKTREKWAAEMKSKSTGSLTISTVGEALEMYKTLPQKSGKSRSLTGVDSYFNRLKSELGHLPIHDAYRGLSIFVDREQKRKAISPETNKKQVVMAPATINRHVAMLKAAVRACHEFRTGIDYCRLIPENYLSGFPLLPENNKRFRTLSRDERNDFWKVLPAMLRPLYYFACRIPARMSELVNIRMADVNVFTQTITIHEGETKNGEGRTLVIPKEFMPYAKQMAQSGAEYLFNRGVEENYLPLGYETSEGIRFSLKKRWASACTTAKLTDYNFHKTRQEAVLTLVAQKWDTADIQHIGGWKSLEAFQRYYNADLALMIRKGGYILDLSWIKTFANDIAASMVSKNGEEEKNIDIMRIKKAL